jgi:YHS domain-containing protein
MLWREISIGFLLAGFIAQVPDRVFRVLFIHSAPAPLPAIENAIVGPVIAVLSFVCSIGNVPLAAVLWSGGIGFAGVLSFLFADLIVLPIIAIYRKYYGTRYALRIVALMFVTMVVAALIVDGLFNLTGLIPTGPRPSRGDIFGTVAVNYKLFLNVLGVVVFALLFWLTQRRGTTDPVCEMKVDRVKALHSDYMGGAYYFCSAACQEAFEDQPERYARPPAASGASRLSTDQSAASSGVS